MMSPPPMARADRDVRANGGKPFAGAEQRARRGRRTSASIAEHGRQTDEVGIQSASGKCQPAI